MSEAVPDVPVFEEDVLLTQPEEKDPVVHVERDPNDTLITLAHLRTYYDRYHEDLDFSTQFGRAKRARGKPKKKTQQDVSDADTFRSECIQSTFNSGEQEPQIQENVVLINGNLYWVQRV